MSREVSNADGRPIETVKDLLGIFRNGARSPSDFKIGVETEKIGVDIRTFEAAPFDGGNGVESILKTLAERKGWTPTLDQDRVIGLTKGKAAVTLEPGGQLELSGKQHDGVEEIAGELRSHLDDLAEISGPKGIRWLNIGLQPMTPLEKIPWVPKSRYRVMKSYYGKVRPDAFEMMALTASAQINMDYSDEQDARKKIHVGAALGPVVGAAFANSGVERGKPNGYRSRRLQIWRKTDPDRCGIRPFFVDGSFSFEKYRDYALDVPMYFIFRDGAYIDKTEKTFRRFLEEKKETPNLGDWELHLTTLFPDVRLKNHLEFRTADANSPERTAALAALWVGLLYDGDALGAVHERLSAFTHAEIETAMDDAAVQGLAASIGKEKILKVARDAADLAAEGLSRRDARTGRSDRLFLEPLQELLSEGLSPAEKSAKHWNGTYRPD